MPTVLLRAIPCEVVHAERSRAHEAHLAFQDVEESRKFIQAAAAHQLAESRESIRVGQELPVGSAGIGHRTEFICLKGLLVEPRAFLHEQDRPPMKNPRRQCSESDDRKKERRQDEGHHQVDDTLPWEQSCDRHLGVVNDMAHNKVTRWDAQHTMESRDYQKL